MRKIICENEDNIAITFGESFSPFLLMYCDGIYGINNTVYSSENTMTDGATYLSSTTRMRNIVLGVSDIKNHGINRNLLYQLFKPKSKGTLTYIDQEDENQIIRNIQYYVESIYIDGAKNCRKAEISLLCPDPFFKDINESTISMAGWDEKFEFDHIFVSEELSVKVNEQIKEIFNDAGADNIGITIMIEADATVVNPSIQHIDANEFISIGTGVNEFVMEKGDVLIITTHSDNKNAFIKRHYSEEKVSVNEYVDEDSSYIQLQSGKNRIRYSAKAGENHMLVDLYFRYRYVGV